MAHQNHCGGVLVFLMQVDALRHDYVTTEDAPFLAGLGREGIAGGLQPTFGFEPDGAYLGGLYPDECDGGAHYWYEPAATPFWFDGRWLAPLNALPDLPKSALRRLLTLVVRRTTAYRHERVPRIPFGAMRHFAPAAKNLPFEPGFADRPTLFSLCREHGITWLFHAAPAWKVKAAVGVQRLLRELRPPIGFAFWHIGELDSAGHRYGPNSAERKAAMRHVDAQIRQVSTHLTRLYSNVHYVIIGDHGMVDVRGTVDVQKSLYEAGIKQGQGVLYSLDSTMARFWFFDKRAKRIVISVLEKLPGGRILRQADLDRYHLNYSHNRFGDLFFLADPGVLISPNFYQGAEIVKGMHGYAPEFADQQSAFIVHSPRVSASVRFERAVDMRWVFPTALKLLGLDLPDSCRVEGII